MGLIFYVSSISYPPQPEPLQKKPVPLLEHVVEFAILGFLLVPGFKGLKFKNFLLLAALIGILYGISDEIHQFFVPGRYSTLLDVVADSLGVLVGVQLAKLKF